MEHDESFSSGWERQKAKLKAKFPGITETDLNYDKAHKGLMLSRLQIKTSRTARELQAILDAP